MKNATPNSNSQLPNIKIPAIPIIIVIGILILILFLAPWVVVPAGHVGVKSLFGQIDKEELQPGFHIKIPIEEVYNYPTRDQKLDLINVSVPSQDQLSTSFDLTVLWKVDTTLAAEALIESGPINDLRSKQLEPSVRTFLREAGKGIARAEEFYNANIQTQMQSQILSNLLILKEKGIIVQKVQIRKIELPTQVSNGVILKKEQEQAAERQKAEFDRFKTEQQQKVASAEAEKNAANQDAERRKALADARAYEITSEAKARAEAIRYEAEALRQNSNLLKLRAIEKWNGTVPKVIMGEGGATPLINLDELSK